MYMKELTREAVTGKRVLVRVDYNIESDARGRLRDVSRLEASWPTIAWLRRRGAVVILLSHRGRPRGRDPKQSLRPCWPVVRRAFGSRVFWRPEKLGSAALSNRLKRLRAGDIALLENLRYTPGEDLNSDATAVQLARLGDLFVNDAFSVSHRPAASVVGITKHLPSYAGLRLATEVEALTPLVRRPRRPYVAIIGGAKISTKLGLVKKLLRRADHVLLGGALANTVLEAEGLAIGRSLSEPTMLRSTRGLTVRNKHLHIPCDVRVRLPSGRSVVRAVGNVGVDEQIVDIGPDTVAMFARAISRARTIVWNGPMGKYETSPYDTGTKLIARLIAGRRVTSVVGGGETVDAIRSQGLTSRFSFVSTGGGAMLEFLEGKRLPGLRAVSIG